MLKAVSEEEKREQRVTCGGRNSGAEIDPFGLVHARIPGVRYSISVGSPLDMACER